MRDIIVFLIIVAGIGFSFYRPYIGVLNWTWLNFMSPHRLGWGFLVSMPVVMVVSVITIAQTFMTKDKWTFPWNTLSSLILIFFLHVSITTLFAMNPVGAADEWNRFLKIIVYIVIVLLMTNSEEKLKWLAIVIGFSFAFYGVKGGVFSILTGGGNRVWGPPGTFIEDNNTLGLALLMAVPLLIYAYNEFDKKWQKLAVIGVIGSCLISIVMTYSRGSLVALIAMAGIYVVRSPYRFKAIVAMVILVSVSIPFIPQKWMDRMNTIQTYEEDASALGRINSWYFAYNLANDKPLIGGGARVFTTQIFLTTPYAPEPENHHDAHSIYFEVLGEQGWLGLFWFLLIFIIGGFKAWTLQKKALSLNKPKLALLLNCIWYSLFAYGTSGTFLGLAYFDFPYTLVAMIIIIEKLMEIEEQKKEPVQVDNKMM